MNKSRRSTQNSSETCLQCKLVVNEKEEDCIECDKCNNLFHVVCTKLDKRKYEYLLNNKSKEFVCHICDDSGTIKAELNGIKEELKKLDQLSSLHDAMNFMSKQFDDILKGMAENKKKLEIVQKENKILKSEVECLKNSVKILNNEKVRNDCLISGIEVVDKVSPVETVLKMSNEAGIVLPPESIDDAYFIKNKNHSARKNEKQMVVVKFNSKRSKETFMSIKPKLKENECTKNVFVNDFLSKETLSLLNYAKSLKKVGYRAVYPVRGNVFIKRSELSRPRIVRCESEVDEILLEATTKKITGRKSQNAIDEEEVYLSS